MKNKLKHFVGFHDWEEVYRKEMPLKVNEYVLGVIYSVIGQLVIEKCSICGKLRAFYTDGRYRTYKDAKYIIHQENIRGIE